MLVMNCTFIVYLILNKNNCYLANISYELTRSDCLLQIFVIKFFRLNDSFKNSAMRFGN